MSNDFECLPVGTAARLAAAESERDALRMQLVACGVVALANTPESAANAREMHPDYRSAACDDVARAVDREMALRAECDALRADAERYRWMREKNGVAVDVIVFGTTHGDLDAAIDAAMKGGGNG